ncbi:MAG: HD domain-containing protein [Roseivirga sp.]
MNYLSTDHLIVYAFLLITLAIGLWAGRGIKDIREYAIANKQFGVEALTLTLLATIVGGSMAINRPGNVSSIGIIASVAALGGFIRYVIAAFCLAPHMYRFQDCLTIGDVAHSMYGTTARVITGVSSLLMVTFLTSMQLLALAVVCQLLGVPAQWSIGLGGILLALYTAHGGIKAVTATDIFQFLVLILGFTLLVSLALKQIGGIPELIKKVPSEKFQIIGHESFPYHLTVFFLLSVFPVTLINPANFQRLLMTKEKRQLRDAFLFTAVFHPLFISLVTLLGLAGFVLYPDKAGNGMVPHMIQSLLPVGMKGLAIAGLLAVVLSTADSYLHVAGLLLTRDILKPFFECKEIKIDELAWTRYSTLIMSCFAIAIAYYTHAETVTAKSFFKLDFIAMQSAGPLLMFPIIAGIMGLKPDKRSFYAAAVAAAVVLIAAKGLLPANLGHLAAPIGILTNGLVFFGAHLIQNQGWAVVERAKKEKRTPWHPQSKLTDPAFIVGQLLRYSREKVQQYGAPYVLFGIFCSLNFTLPYFMWVPETPETHDLMLYIRVIGATMCGLLVVKGRWAEYLQPYLPTFWHLTLLYCIPFTSTVMFLLTQGSTEWLINVAITIMFLIVLVDWMSFVILTALGIGLGFLFYTQLIGPINIQLDFSSGYLLVYQGLFATLIGLLFARRKQQRFDALATHNQALTLVGEENKEKLLEAVRERVRIIQTLKHARIQDLLQVAKLIKDLRLKAKKVPDLLEVTTQLEGTLIPMTLQLRGIEDRATNFLRLSVEQLTIQALLEAVKGQLVAQGKDQGIQFYTQTKHQELSCDPKRIQELLVSSIKALQGASDEAPILVGIEDTILSYPLPSVLPDFLKNVKALRMTLTTRSTLPPLWEGYRVQLEGGELTTPETAQELMLLENKRIVKAHYGYTDAQADTLSYIIPLDIGEVRPKDLDKPYMELGVSPVRADDHYEGAQRQEEAFLEAVQAKSEADIETVKSVLELIKWYHGPVSRRSGEPFYLHPVAVAQIVLDYNTDEATILGALLHDTVEDTSMLLEDVEAVFGKETAGIVDTVTHLESQKESFYKVKLSAEENLLMLIEANDKRALYVKVADRMHNMRTISAKPLKSQLKTAKETLEFFVPLCKERLALAEAAEELKARSLSVIAQEPTL